MKFDVQGLIVAPCTPMQEDGSVNLAPILEYAEYLHEKQCVDNVFVLGTTGEGQNLTIEERKMVSEAWMRHGRDIFKRIIIHVGAGNLKETQELAKHAEKINADAIAIAPPTYFKPETVEQLGDYLAATAKTVPDTPVLFYHLPEMTGANFAMLDLLDNTVDRVPNFAGMKFVTFLLSDFGRCQRKYGDRVSLSYGKDEALLFAALLGGDSFVGASFNYIGKFFKEMFDLYRNNDISAAAKKQQDIQVILQKVGHKGNLKALTGLISGIPLGPPRAPVPEGVNVDLIVKEVEQTGLLKF